MQRTASYIARLSLFVAIIVGSDYLLAPIYNVKLVDCFVFIAAFMYGFRFGAITGIITELIWSVFNPLGFGGAIIPFLISGEIIYAAAGSFARRVWKAGNLPNPVFGALLATCSFIWDIWTNFGTALIAYGSSLNIKELIGVELFGIPFMVAHELSNFVFGSISPVMIYSASKLERMHSLEPAIKEGLA